MSFSISFSSKAVLFAAVLLAVNPWGCARNKTGAPAFLPDAGAAEQKAATAGQTPALAVYGDFLIAVLPVENLSGINAPLEDIGNEIGSGLARIGFRVLDQNALEHFRKKHRMRYTGGVNSALSEAMLKEIGADAVLITSLEAYQEAGPPQVSLIARLVSCGPQPEIVWMDSVGLSGDESPGLLDLKRIRESRELIEKAVGILTDFLAAGFVPETLGADSRELGTPQRAGGPGNLLSSGRLNRKYMPYDYFRSPIIEPGRKYSIAVLPMLNAAPRKNAGIITQLHYVRELVNMTDYRVLEPGVVREGLLTIRAIMPHGPSLAETDLLTGEYLFGADLVLSGKVFDYQNTSRDPKVDFSMRIIEKNSRQVVFGARTFSTGMDGVFFFDFGRVYTAHNLLKELSRVTVQLLVTPSRSRKRRKGFSINS
jgi:hypothetical protein